jgi:hypothetical protein
VLTIVDGENVRLELLVEIASDADRASVEFWKVWLWQSQEVPGYPSPAHCAALAERFGVSSGEVQQQWLAWYVLLTSWEFASALVGRDVRAIAPSYGFSHRRA